MKRTLFVICLVVALLMAPAGAAVTVINGNHYDNSDIYANKYVVPAPSADELFAMSMGHVFGSLRTVGCTDDDSLRFTMTWNQDPDNPIEYKFGKDGRFDGFFPPGTYEIEVLKGTGSGDPPNNWHPERTTIKVVGGQRTDFSLIGNGRSCGGGDELRVTQTAAGCPTITGFEARKSGAWFLPFWWFEYTVHNPSDKWQDVTIQYSYTCGSGGPEMYTFSPFVPFHPGDNPTRVIPTDCKKTKTMTINSYQITGCHDVECDHGPT